MKLARFVLEDWFREHYFDTEIVLCLSGVEEFSLGDIRNIIGLSQEEMDSIVFVDNPPEGDLSLRRAIAPTMERWKSRKRHRYSWLKRSYVRCDECSSGYE